MSPYTYLNQELDDMLMDGPIVTIFSTYIDADSSEIRQILPPSFTPTVS